MSRRRADGASEAAHLRQAQRTKRWKLKKPIEFFDPDIEEPPEGTEFLWNAFCKLSASRPYGGFGPSPIAFSDVLAWCSLYGLCLSEWELDVIGDLDALWLKEATDARPSKPDGKRGQQRGGDGDGEAEGTD